MNSFNSNSPKPIIDLSDFKFISDDHIRYESGTDVSGHNRNAWRGIRVQRNVDDQNYIVTMYSLEGNHPFWGDNIQMAPKQMKIVEQSSSEIKLRGYGTDGMGGAFADYALTLNIIDNSVDNVVLHMIDRGIDILYFKANNSNDKKNDPIIENSNSPSSNLLEVVSLSQLIHKCEDLSMLNYAYNQYGDYNHPQICYDFGTEFLIKGDKNKAQEVLFKGAKYGTKFPCAIYGNALIDSVGQCMALLMTQFPNGERKYSLKVTALAYIYLSRCIELHPNDAQDSYRTRALLFANHQGGFQVQTLIMDNVGMGVMPEPFIISDFYFASQIVNSPYRNALQSAQRIHHSLGDTTIGGKDADEYTLEEMAEFGSKRHQMLFKKLEEKYKSGTFDLAAEELAQAVK